MAAPTLTFESLRAQIASKKLAPVYILHGEEGYFLDVLVKDFENVLPEADKEFNQYILYAPQTDSETVRNLCQRYPMMADRQVVILKEAQAVRADQINKLYKYVENPSPMTVLVVVFRGEKAKGKELLAAAKSKGAIFESKKIPDYQLGTHINNYVRSIGMTADVKSVEMLKEFIGSDLSRMFNEIEKLHTLLGKGAAITPEAIERNIGISKDYNSFELVDALAVRNFAKAMRIVDYFTSNPKNNPTVMTIASIFSFFSDLLVAMYAKDKTDQGLMAELNLKSSFPLRRFRAAMQQYNAFQVIEVIWALRQCDTRAKGNGSRQNEYNLLHDLVFHILTAPGNLGV